LPLKTNKKKVFTKPSENRVREKADKGLEKDYFALQIQKCQNTKAPMDFLEQSLKFSANSDPKLLQNELGLRHGAKMPKAQIRVSKAKLSLDQEIEEDIDTESKLSSFSNLFEPNHLKFYRKNYDITQ